MASRWLELHPAPSYIEMKTALPSKKETNKQMKTKQTSRNQKMTAAKQTSKDISTNRSKTATTTTTTQ